MLILSRFLLDRRIAVQVFTLLTVWMLLSPLSFSKEIEMGKTSFGLINHIAFDDNVAWLGGENGIYRIHGNLVEYFDENETGISSHISWILPENQSKLWITTLEKGLIVYSQSTKNFTDITSLANQRCWKVIDLNEGYVAVACETGLFMVDRTSLEVRTIISAQDNSPYPIVSASRASDTSLVFQGTRGQLWEIDLTGQVKKKLAIPESIVTELHTDQRGNIWLTNGADLFWLGFSKTEFEQIALPPNTKIGEIRGFVEKAGQLFAYGGSLLELSVDKEKNIAISKVSDQFGNQDARNIGAISVNQDGDLLAYVNGQGLVYLDSIDSRLFENLSGATLNGNLTASQLVDEENLIVALDDHLYRFNTRTRSNESIHITNDLVTSISLLDSNELVYFGLEKGLVHLRNNGKEGYVARRFGADYFEKTGTKIHSLATSGSVVFGGAVNGAYNGLHKIDDKGNHDILLPGQDVEFVANLDDHTILAFSGNGVFKITNDKPIEALGTLALDSRSTIYCSTMLDRFTILLCADGEGLIELDTRTGSSVLHEGPFGRHIRSIVNVSDGDFLIASNRGLFQFNIEDNSSFPLGQENGMYDTDFEFNSSIRIEDSNAILAGDRFNYAVNIPLLKRYVSERKNKRYTVQYPWYLLNKELENPLYENRVGFERRFLNRQNHLSIEEGFSFLEIYFTTQNVLLDRSPSFEYRVSGISDNWLSTNEGQQSITLTTLPAGEYKVEVRARDIRSEIEQPTTNLRIDVTPPFYKTWQAYIGYTIVLIVLWLSIYRYRTKQLLERNKTLEKSVADRTLALAASNKKISNMLDQKAALFTHVSHELRTPLTLIEGPLNELRHQAQDTNSFKLINIMTRSVKRLNELVDELLELAKIDSLQEPLLHNYNIPETITFLKASFLPLIQQRELNLTVDVGYDGNLLLTKGSLEKILSNLLLNAIKFTPKLGNINLYCSTNGENELVICVSDNGGGINEADIPRVFEKFHQAEAGNKYGGVGLGLSIVKELVQKNKGEISLVSELGKGSRFTITFPLRFGEQADPVSIAVSNPTPEQQQEDSYTSLQAEVLVIDDNEDMRAFLHHILKPKFTCCFAKDGIEGFHRAKERIPDLIVTDVMMPYCDGISLLDQIRQEEKTSHIPVIVITAKGDDATRLNCFQNNADDYLMKPFSSEELVVRLERLLSIRTILSKKNSGILSLADADNKTAGFELPELTFSHPNDKKFYERFAQVIEEHYNNAELNRAFAAKLLAVSERQLNRKLAAIVEYNFSQYLNHYRLQKAKQLLKQGVQVTEVSYDVGFSTPSYFSRSFKKEFNLTPKEYANRSISI